MHNLATQHFGGYPLNALHNNPNELLTGAGTDAKAFRHEYDFDDTELNYISETGGFFGVRLGPFDAANYGECDRHPGRAFSDHDELRPRARHRLPP